MFIVEVAVNLWSPHYCRFSLSLSLPRIRVACASGSPPVPAPFRRLLSSDFPLFRRFSSCLKSIHGFFLFFLFFIMDPLAHDQTSHVESRTSQRIERKKDRSRLGNWNVVSSLLETILSQKKKKKKGRKKAAASVRHRGVITTRRRIKNQTWLEDFRGKALGKELFRTELIRQTEYFELLA